MTLQLEQEIMELKMHETAINSMQKDSLRINTDLTTAEDYVVATSSAIPSLPRSRLLQSQSTTQVENSRIFDACADAVQKIKDFKPIQPVFHAKPQGSFEQQKLQLLKQTELLKQKDQLMAEQQDVILQSATRSLNNFQNQLYQMVEQKTHPKLNKTEQLFQQNLPYLQQPGEIQLDFVVKEPKYLCNKNSGIQVEDLQPLCQSASARLAESSRVVESQSVLQSRLDKLEQELCQKPLQIGSQKQQLGNVNVRDQNLNVQSVKQVQNNQVQQNDKVQKDNVFQNSEQQQIAVRTFKSAPLAAEQPQQQAVKVVQSFRRDDDLIHEFEKEFASVEIEAPVEEDEDDLFRADARVVQ